MIPRPPHRSKCLLAGFSKHSWGRSIIGTLVLLLATDAQAGTNDWPRFRGPNADGISGEATWQSVWPKDGPTQLWRVSVGTGFSGIAVKDGAMYTMGNSGGKDTIYCFNAASGKSVWSYSYTCALDPNMFEGGPTGTPAVDGRYVYTSSRQGHIFCLEAMTGKLVWFRNLQKELELAAPGWGFGASPLVEGNLVIVNMGSGGTALDKLTGKVAWTSEPAGAGYAMPVPCQLDGQRSVAIFAAAALVVVDPLTGRERWRHPWTGSDVNAADPVIAGDQIFLSSGYGVGATLLQANGRRPVILWKNDAMQNHFNGSVHLNGFVYGISGQAGEECELRCVELKTGAIKWGEKITGYGSLIIADGKLILMIERGELIVANATPAAFKTISRAQVMGGKCWVAPVLVDGRIYCRNAQGTVVCVDARRAE